MKKSIATRIILLKKIADEEWSYRSLVDYDRLNSIVGRMGDNSPISIRVNELASKTNWNKNDWSDAYRYGIIDEPAYKEAMRSYKQSIYIKEYDSNGNFPLSKIDDMWEHSILSYDQRENLLDTRKKYLKDNLSSLDLTGAKDALTLKLIDKNTYDSIVAKLSGKPTQSAAPASQRSSQAKSPKSTSSSSQAEENKESLSSLMSGITPLIINTQYVPNTLAGKYLPNLGRLAQQIYNTTADQVPNLATELYGTLKGLMTELPPENNQTKIFLDGYLKILAPLMSAANQAAVASK